MLVAQHGMHATVRTYDGKTTLIQPNGLILYTSDLRAIMKEFGKKMCWFDYTLGFGVQ